MKRSTDVGGTLLRRALCAVVTAYVMIGVLVPRAVGAETITVFAAASLTESLEDIAASHPRFTWRLSFASSAMLAKQIEAGGPADIYISANERWMDHLQKIGAVQAQDRTALLSNRLALVVPHDSQLAIKPTQGFALAQALGDGWLALGNPDHVPGGIYAKESLINLGVWDAVRKKVAPMNNIRAALNLVARGEAAAGIVYATDAPITDRVRTVALLPASSHRPIVYSAAIVAERDRPTVRAAFAIIRSKSAAQIFTRRGFQFLPQVGQ